MHTIIIVAFIPFYLIVTSIRFWIQIVFLIFLYSTFPNIFCSSQGRIYGGATRAFVPGPPQNRNRIHRFYLLLVINEKLVFIYSYYRI
jgi:hypothetical protein